MLTTAYKSKLPKALSFPIGAQELSDALSEVPQYEDMTINFYGSPTDYASEFSDILREHRAYPIVCGKFSHVRLGLSECKEMAERGLYDETWEIVVYPVESNRRHAAHQCLKSTGLQQLKEWLSIRSPDTWRWGRHAFNIIFNPVQGVISVCDSDD